MKNQIGRLNKAIELLEKDIELRGGGLRYFIDKTEWAGDRYMFLNDLDALCGVDGYDYEVHLDKVIITIRGHENTVPNQILFLYDSNFSEK